MTDSREGQIVFDNPKIVHGDKLIVKRINGEYIIGTAYYSFDFTEESEEDGYVTYRSDYYNCPYCEDDCHTVGIYDVILPNKVIIDEQYEALYE